MKKKYNTEFYHAIDKLCIEKRITHRELAEIVGVNEVTLSRYLTGERIMSLSAFMELCKTFDITAEDLYKIYLFSKMRQRVTERNMKPQAESEEQKNVKC